MRHDSHFVDEITSQHLPESVGRMIDIRRVEPNPHQPRKHFGDLSEMVASVKEKGILEPILVRTNEDKYQIIAGERRYQAAKLAGLQRIPCIEVDVDHRGMLEISLIENLQRKDLTPFEEAAALQRLVDQFRYTHEEISKKLGKSRTVITEMLSLNRIPDDVQERCRHADIVSKSMLLQIARQSTPDEMHRLVDRISGDGMTLRTGDEGLPVHADLRKTGGRPAGADRGPRGDPCAPDGRGGGAGAVWLQGEPGA
jgi:ParB family chromosome partitioning protein